MHKGVLLACAGLVVVGSGGLVVPVAAQGNTRCNFTLEVAVSPGFSTNPSTGVFATEGGEMGTISCNGPIDGKQPTGPGAIGVEAGRYGTEDPDTCTGSEGAAVHSMTIPTAHGPARYKDRFTYRFGELSMGGDQPALGTFDGERLSGTFNLSVIEGDCLTEPVTRARVNAEGTFR